MAVRMYLFAMSTTPQMAMANYMASDHPENLERWRSRWPFNEPGNTSRYDAVVSFYQRYQGYMRDPAKLVQLGPDSWGWADITSWQDASVPFDDKLASIPPRMRAFLAATPESVPVVQWVNPMDVALATAWLARARQYTPPQINAMSPADQCLKIIEMWAAFANYFKAINISPQAWDMYRDAWEFYARPLQSIGLLLKGPSGWLPRPCSAPLPSPCGRLYADDGVGIQAPGFTLATGSGQAMIDAAGPWRAEALRMAGYNSYTARPSITNEGIRTNVVFGNVFAPQPSGPAVYGAPSSRGNPGGTWGRQQCQEGVVMGSSCFGPMRESHFVWLNNNAMLVGGMNPIWQGVTVSDGGGYDQVSQCAWAFEPDQPKPTTPGAYNWLTDYRQVRVVRGVRSEWDDRDPQGALTEPDRTTQLQYQPPAKRYVELLWPLLDFLAQHDPREVAVLIMRGVLGKNTFSMFAAGASTPEALESALSGALGQDRTRSEQAAQRSRSVVSLVEGVITAGATLAATLVGSPLAGAAMGSALNVMFATGDTLGEQTSLSSHMANAPWDVFGRPDAVWTVSDRRIGMIERYAILRITDPNAIEGIQGEMYRSIRILSTPGNGPTYQRSSFVVPEPARVPWPVGHELQTEPGDATQPHTTIFVALPGLSGAVLQSLLDRPRPVPARVTDAGGSSGGGPSMGAMLFVGIATGAAIGLAVAARQRSGGETRADRKERRGR